MSKRWFILAFSIIFFIAFRAWIDDLSLPDHSEPLRVHAATIHSDENNPLLIFPVSGESKTFDKQDLVFVNTIDGQMGQRETKRYPAYESLYIFPDWPDTLSFNFLEVLVDNHELFNSYINKD